MAGLAPERDRERSIGDQMRAWNVGIMDHLLCDLLDLVQQMNVQLASHAHGATPVPGNAGAFTSNAGAATKLMEKLKPITM